MDEGTVMRRLSELIDRIDLLTCELEKIAAAGENTDEALGNLEGVLEEYRLMRKGISA